MSTHADLLDGVIADIAARRQELAPLVLEYVRLVEAERLLGELDAPPAPTRARTRGRTRRLRAVPDVQPSPAAASMTLRVQTLGTPSRDEVERSDVVYTTEQPARAMP